MHCIKHRGERGRGWSDEQATIKPGDTFPGLSHALEPALTGDGELFRLRPTYDARETGSVRRFAISKEVVNFNADAG
jgi:hypothetical protein